MGDPVAVIVGKLEVWVETVLTTIKEILTSIKEIKQKYSELKKEVSTNYNELVKKDADQALDIQKILSERDHCYKAIGDIETVIKFHNKKFKETNNPQKEDISMNPLKIFSALSPFVKSILIIALAAIVISSMAYGVFPELIDMFKE